MTAIENPRVRFVFGVGNPERSASLFCARSRAGAAGGDTLLTVRHLSILHSRDLRPLIRDLSFTLAGTERLAVIGEEGNGKSALLKALCDPEALRGWAQTEGSASFDGERPAYLAQETPAEWADQPVYALCMADAGFAACGPDRLAALCRELDLSPELCWRDTPFGLLSGGEKVRLRLLLALCGLPSMLVLDEPGNDLDLGALETLERFLPACGLPVLYVSHDERLLMRTATAVLHLESLHGRAEPRWTLAKIPYAEYVARRRQRLDRQEQQWQMERREERSRQEKLQRIENAVAHAQANISRRDPHGGRLLKKKMKAVKSLEHRYDREREDGTERPSEEFAMDALFRDRPPIPAGRGVLDVTLPEVSAGGRVLLRDVTVRLRGPEKLLITGPNGSGKTTLLRALAEALAVRGGLKAALMPQRYEELLPPEMTPVEFLHTRGDKDQLTYIRLSLGAMKLTREEMAHPIAALSGGQKAKVLLLRMMLAEPDVLILDEPTRNLSPLSAPVMRRLIRTFPGAVICVTHDRLLIEDWPGPVTQIRDGRLIAGE